MNLAGYYSRVNPQTSTIVSTPDEDWLLQIWYHSCEGKVRDQVSVLRVGSIRVVGASLLLRELNSIPHLIRLTHAASISSLGSVVQTPHGVG